MRLAADSGAAELAPVPVEDADDVVGNADDDDAVVCDWLRCAIFDNEFVDAVPAIRSACVS